MDDRGILTFRCDKSCTFRDQFYVAHDEPGDHLMSYSFPASLVLDVPQHFTALDDDGNDDVVLQDLRTKFFAWSKKELAGATGIDVEAIGASVKVIQARIEEAKPNFIGYGQPEAPKAPAGAGAEAGAEGDEIDKMTKTDLGIKLDELKVDYKTSDSKDVLVAKLREALAAKAAGSN